LYSGKEPNWTEELKNRKTGDTNFVQCGWCDHASGVHQYGACLSGSCTFISRANETSVKYLKNLKKEVDWSDKCQIIHLTHYKIERLIRMWERNIDGAKSKVKRLEKETDHLRDVSKTAYVMPPLPDNRPWEYYNEGDRIAVTFDYRDRSEDGDKPLFVKYGALLDMWMVATVKEGYRHHDGVVSYEIDKLSESKDGGWGSGTGTPGIFKMESVRHFIKNPSDYTEWCILFMADTWRSKPNWTIPEPKIIDWLYLLEVVE